MQLLFSLSRDKDLTYKDLNGRYWEGIEKTFELYLLNIYVLIHVAKEALGDAEKKTKKHLPNDLDKAFKPKLFTNGIIQELNSNKTLLAKFTKHNFSEVGNEDYYKKIYSEFSKTEEYKAYILAESTDEQHLEIILELYRFCRKDEFFLELVEDAYPNWIDDKSVVVGSVKKTMKSLPNDKPDFFMAFYPDQETILEFGEPLLKETFDNAKALLNMIKPCLVNWDHERVAIIDMILLKMAISELLNCETIPTKVTINEYVEVSKMYSTPKSKEFINGVLDTILTKLIEEGKINKVGRGLVE